MNFHNVVFEASYGLFSQIPEGELPEIAFSGRSNVGKSSLINKIFNRKSLARVSAVPGKTATINFFRMEGLRFADLPGYGYAKVSKSEKERWAGLIGGYLQSGRDIALIFQLIDMRHPPTRDDLQMIEFLVEWEMPFAVVLTKRDKLSPRQQAQRLEELRAEIPYGDQIVMLPVSSQTGEGIEAVREVIEEVAAGCASNAGEEGQKLPEEPSEQEYVQKAIEEFRRRAASGEPEEQARLPLRPRTGRR